MRPVTKRQNEVLSAIKTHIKQNGFPPTLEDISDAMAIHISAVRQHLVVLRTKGLVTFEDGRIGRTLRIV